MTHTIANMIWPALYVAGGYSQLWYLIFPTIIIEAIAIHFILKSKWGISILASVLGNILSSVAGTIVMTFAMILYHLLADGIISYFSGNGGTFNDFNWGATFVIMCLGSVFIETYAVRRGLGTKFGVTFLTLLVGNAITYSLTAILMANGIINISQ